MARSLSTDLPANACDASPVPVYQAHGTSTAVVNPIDNDECRVGNHKLVFSAPTLGSEPDDYIANVSYATFSISV